MVTLTVNGSQVSPEDESAIAQQVNRRRGDGVAVCVQVRINEGDLHMILSTPQCSGVGGGGRPPNVREKRIFDLWEKLGLNGQEIAGGQVIAFLHQLPRLTA